MLTLCKWNENERDEKMKYNYNREVEIIEDGFRRLNSRKLDPTKPFGNLAMFDLKEVINLWLVGQHEQAAKFLPAIIEWLDAAIAKEEVFGTWYLHASNMHQARAIAGWMHDRSDCFENWNMARYYLEQAWQEPVRPWSRKEVVASLDDYLMFAVMSGGQSQVWQNAIGMYDSWLGPKVETVRKTQGLRDYSYLLLQNNLGQRKESDVDLLRCGRNVLRRGLYERWLGSGQILKAASVLKLVYVNRYLSLDGSHDPQLSPLETIYRAFDAMPEIPSPMFLKPRPDC